ncbi:hypothetical protein OAB44_01105 [Pelagibacteraceae bacterium]|nr:hypothetical protein [Pelagibacteraceae bacterium]
MKYIFFLFILFLSSCSVSKQTYICGDHPCLDNKEFKKFFSDNLLVEIQTKNNQKSSIDLVKLNSKNNLEKKEGNDLFILDKKLSSKEKRVKLKIEKKKLKEQRTKLKEERRIKKIEEKNKAKNLKKLAKLKKSNNIDKEKINVNRIFKKKILPKESIITEIKKITQTEVKEVENQIVFKSTISENKKSICEQIKDCNIDKISDLLTKKGREKDFPNINSK